MKVLHVVNISFVLPYFIGGQFDFFPKKDIKFFVACTPSDDFFKYAKEKSFEPVPVPVLREINLVQDIKTIVTLYKLIKKEKIEVVIGHTPKGGLLAMIAAYCAGNGNRIYFRHGIMYETSSGLKKTILKSIEKLTGKLATKVVCVSKFVLEFSNNNQLSAKSKNIILGRGSCNGVDALTRFNPKLISVRRTRDEFGIAQNDFVLGYVGRLVNDKGINELITAYKITKSKIGKRFKLLLIGPYEERDSLSPKIKTLIENDPDIFHIGLVDDVENYYQLMDVFILPSYREGFGTVNLEASSMELPVLTTQHTGCRDSILNNVTGKYITLDPKDISEKIMYYFEHPDVAVKHGKNGRAFVLEFFEQHSVWADIDRELFQFKN